MGTPERTYRRMVSRSKVLGVARSPTLRDRPRLNQSARLAQEAEGCCHRSRLTKVI
jgi:hypothetical protein